MEQRQNQMIRSLRKLVKDRRTRSVFDSRETKKRGEMNFISTDFLIQRHRIKADKTSFSTQRAKFYELYGEEETMPAHFGEKCRIFDENYPLITPEKELDEIDSISRILTVFMESDL